MFVPKRDQKSPKQYLADYLNNSGGFISYQNSSETQRLLQEATPGKMLAQFMLSSQNAGIMEKLTNKCEVFNILVNTEKGHPALQKFVQTGGIGPILKMCEQIRENKVVTLVDRACP